MPKKKLIIFWGSPLCDRQCLNMMLQFLEQKYEMGVLRLGLKAETKIS